jgi:hypothetical protein
VDEIVGWVEQRETQHFQGVGVLETQHFQGVGVLVLVGFRYRSTQPTGWYKQIDLVRISKHPLKPKA